MATKIFRWKAIVPVVLFLALVTVLWIIFADRIIRSQIEDVGSSTLGYRARSRLVPAQGKRRGDGHGRAADRQSQ
jgi:hypothetical protein